MSIINEFISASGHRINKEKSAVFIDGGAFSFGKGIILDPFLLDTVYWISSGLLLVLLFFVKGTHVSQQAFCLMIGPRWVL